MAHCVLQRLSLLAKAHGGPREVRRRHQAHTRKVAYGSQNAEYRSRHHQARGAATHFPYKTDCTMRSTLVQHAPLRNTLRSWSGKTRQEPCLDQILRFIPPKLTASCEQSQKDRIPNVFQPPALVFAAVDLCAGYPRTSVGLRRLLQAQAGLCSSSLIKRSYQRDWTRKNVLLRPLI